MNRTARKELGRYLIFSWSPPRVEKGSSTFSLKSIGVDKSAAWDKGTEFGFEPPEFVSLGLEFLEKAFLQMGGLSNNLTVYAACLSFIEKDA
jgi:hypothetical protein